ncbi:hypothetical protein L226DRAFT_353272 [Lentinus tigrinus ALCF2SS1-7]|uniref:uncharacterized protein n=1 Tax=Lentinus tigrinus ALCF2SS1-7 TaxID=1328758 RepID=UPI0011661D95|nr:hypothetical protein L226DRAFT_353272 [Lentinus tigrinus ALCF2SS1-7]
MQNPHLPIELCELVIDFTLDLGTWWEYRHPGRNTDFVKYTSICSALLPCGRRVLYHTATFGDPSQVHLFTRSIVENPSLADMVRELVLWPTVEGTYIPFVHATLVKRLRHLKGLVYNLGRTEAHAVYPPLHHLLVASIPITELVIRLPDGVPSRKTWFEAFRLIWSLRHLRSLHLTGQEHPNVSHLDVQRLNAIRRPWACSELKTLALQGVRTAYTTAICLNMHSGHLSGSCLSISPVMGLTSARRC